MSARGGMQVNVHWAYEDNDDSELGVPYLAEFYILEGRWLTVADGTRIAARRLFENYAAAELHKPVRRWILTRSGSFWIC